MNPEASIKEKLQIQSELNKTVRDMTKYLTLFSEESTASRLWMKETQLNHLDTIVEKAKLEK